jgi:hypothetical protein
VAMEGVMPSSSARARIKRLVELVEERPRTAAELMAEIPGLNAVAISQARWRGVIQQEGDLFCPPTAGGVPAEAVRAASVWDYAARCGHEPGASDRGADADDRWTALAGGA